MAKKKQIVFPVLEAEIARRGIRKYELADTLRIKPRTFSNKMNGSIGFSLKEAIEIKQTWFPDIPVEELFKKT